MKHFLLASCCIGFLAIGVGAAPRSAQAAAQFFMTPSSGAYKVGDTINAWVVLDTGGQSVNAAQGSVTYPADLLEFENVATTSVNSIFTFWTNGPTGDATNVNFGGGLPNPGYNGKNGKVLQITWKAKGSGTATVTVKGSKILANDGAGTNIYGASSGAKFTIGKSVPPAAVVTVASSSHPNQDSWYSINKIVVSWSTNVAVSGFAWSLDHDAQSNPPNNPLITDLTKTFDTVADGVWFFHIKGRTSNGFTPIVTYRLHIDTTPPEPFAVTVNQLKKTAPRPTASFQTTDALSGISRYEGQLDAQPIFAINSGDVLPKQAVGRHTLIVRAIDLAGNARESQADFTIEAIAPPKIISWTKQVGLLEPIDFTGQSQSGDTIAVFVDGKLVETFLANDRQVSLDAGGIITWRYTHHRPLFPGAYRFQFKRIDSDEAESKLTAAVTTTVLASVIKFFNTLVSTTTVIIILLAIILLLIAIIIFLLWRRRRSTCDDQPNRLSQPIKSGKSRLKSEENNPRP